MSSSRTAERVGEQLAELIGEIISEHEDDRTVAAEDVDDLGDFIADAIKDNGVDANHINGLGDEIESKIDDYDFDDKFEAVFDQSTDKVVERVLGSEAFKTKLDELVRESMVRAFAQLIQPPVALPVLNTLHWGKSEPAFPPLEFTDQ